MIFLPFLFPQIFAADISHYNSTNILLERVVIIPMFRALSTDLFLDCNHVLSFTLFDHGLSFDCTGNVTNKVETSMLTLYITVAFDGLKSIKRVQDENFDLPLPSNPYYNLTTNCQEGVNKTNGDRLILTGQTNRLTSSTNAKFWIDYCGTFNVTLFYVQTDLENNVYPTKVVERAVTVIHEENYTVEHVVEIKGSEKKFMIFLLLDVFESLVLLAGLVLIVYKIFKKKSGKLWRERFLTNISSMSGLFSKGQTAQDNPYEDIIPYDPTAPSSETDQVPPQTPQNHVYEQPKSKDRTESTLSQESGVFSVVSSPAGNPPVDTRPIAEVRSRLENQTYISGEEQRLQRPGRLSLERRSTESQLVSPQSSSSGRSRSTSKSSLGDGQSPWMKTLDSIQEVYDL